MSAPDFAAILTDAADDVRVKCMSYCYGGSFNVPEAVALQLATKVPELCQVCGGTGERHYEWGGKAGTFDPCPDCPTIARLLAIGVAVMSGRVELPAVTFGGTPNWQQQDRHDGAAWLLAELREVQP